MKWFTKVFARPQTSRRAFRTSLRLEELGVRATPSDLEVLPPGSPPAPPPAIVVPPLGNPPPGNPPTAIAPNIDRFVAIEVARGWYQIEGHVTAAQAGGLVVSFAGVPALNGKTATTTADGNFVLVVQVQTDGTDSDTITAQTVDANGNVSNVAISSMSPT